MYKIKLYEIFKEIKLFVYPAFAYLSINIEVAKIFVYLMLIDTATGFFKSILMPNEKTSFKILLTGVCTKSVLLLIPIVLALCSKGLGYDLRFLPDTVMKLFIVAETFSIITNFYIMKTGKKIENIDLVSKTILFIRQSLLQYFQKLTKIEEK